MHASGDRRQDRWQLFTSLDITPFDRVWRVSISAVINEINNTILRLILFTFLLTIFELRYPRMHKFHNQSNKSTAEILLSLSCVLR